MLLLWLIGIPILVALAAAYIFIVVVFLIAEKLFLGVAYMVRWQIDARSARRARARRLELELPEPVERSAHGPSASRAWRRE